MSVMTAAFRTPSLVAPLVSKGASVSRNATRNAASAAEHSVEEGLKKGMQVMNNRTSIGDAANMSGTLSWAQKHPKSMAAARFLGTELLIQGAILAAPWAVGLFCPPLGAALGMMTGGAAMFRGLHAGGMVVGAGFRGAARWAGTRGAREVVKESAHLGGAAASKAMAAGSRNIFQRGGSAVSTFSKNQVGKLKEVWRGDPSLVAPKAVAQAEKAVARDLSTVTAKVGPERPHSLFRGKAPASIQQAQRVEREAAKAGSKHVDDVGPRLEAAEKQAELAAARSTASAGKGAVAQGAEQAAGKSIAGEATKEGSSWGTNLMLMGGSALQGMGSTMKGALAGIGLAVGMASQAVGTGLSSSGMDGRPIMTMGGGAEGGGGAKADPSAGAGLEAPRENSSPQTVAPMYAPVGGGAGGKQAPSKGANAARDNLNKSFKGGGPKPAPRTPMPHR